VLQLLPWKSNKYYILRVCVCSLIYSARKACAPCCIVICGLSDSAIFSHIINGAIFVKKIIEHKMYFGFPTISV
jgi:hypothetical protein